MACWPWRAAFFLMRTYAPKPKDIERRWYVVDADGAVLGRLASEVAQVLRGKHKPIYAPHADTGDHVVVINARKIRLSGDKEAKKIDYRHSGYPGGLKETDYARLMRERPAYVVEKAVKGMLPKSSLGRSMFAKLTVYEDAEHPHEAQKPVPLKVGERPAWTGLPEPPPVPEPRKKETPKRKPAAKRTTSKRTTAKTAAKPAAKRTAKRATAKRTSAAKKRTTRRKKKE